jgi:outer membrane lipoprotein SlyB
MIRATLGVVALGLSLGAVADDRYVYDRPGHNPGPYAYQGEARAADHGRVVAIDVIPGEGTDTHHSTGVGTVLGGIAGGVLGHQIGSGRGNTAATIAGAAGGAYAGHQIQEHRNESGSGDQYRVTVRFDDGREDTIVQDRINDLRVGDRVRIDHGRAVHD